MKRISSLVTYLKKPYGLLESKGFVYAFVFGMAVFAFAFLWIFEPFGLENLTDNEKWPVISAYAGAALGISVLQFLVVQPLLFKRFRVYSTFLWLMLYLVLIGLSNAFINSFLWNDGQINLYNILFFQWIVLSIASLPIALFITLHYAWLMHKRAEKAMAINRRMNTENTPESENTITLCNSNGKEELKLSKAKLLCIKSDDNYAEIHFLDSSQVKKHLVRNTLHNLEKQLGADNDFLRCHKSYIVNKSKIKEVSGNAAGYKLHLSHLDFEIPVSRKLNSRIQSILS